MRGRIWFLAFSLLLTASCAATNPPGPGTSAPRAGKKSVRPPGRHAWTPEELAVIAEKGTHTPALGESNDPLLAILKQYSPDAYQLIRTTYALPSTIQIGGSSYVSIPNDPRGFRQYIMSENQDEILRWLSVAVHETSHLFTGLWPAYQLSFHVTSLIDLPTSPDDRQPARFSRLQAHFFSADRSYIVRVHAVFPSDEIIARIPPELRTGRFNTYIAEDSNRRSRVDGIYGLMDEFSAYYQDLKLQYELYDHYRAMPVQSRELWARFLEFGTYPAWAEFRYWILTYLLHAREKHPETYRFLMRDERLRTAFTEFDDAFMQLFKAIYTRITVELPEHLRSVGIASRIGRNGDDAVFELGEKGGSILVPVGRLDDIRLVDAMSAPAYREIADAFRTRKAPPLVAYFR